MNKRQRRKRRIITAAALAAVASLIGCADRIPEEAKQRMEAFQVHFDAMLFYVFICNKDGLIGFYFEGEALRYIRTPEPLKTGTWNAYLTEDGTEPVLALVRCADVQLVKIDRDTAAWWRESFADGAPVLIYDEEEKE